MADISRRAMFKATGAIGALMLPAGLALDDASALVHQKHKARSSPEKPPPAPAMATPAERRQTSSNNGGEPLKFILDGNLGLPAQTKPWSDIFSNLGIQAESTTDLVDIDKRVADHEPDIAYIPTGDFHRVFAKGDHHYRGLAISTSKFTGNTTLRILLVVRKDDPANSLEDLRGVKYGYINKSCSSTYFPPAILLARQGRKLEDFLQITPVKPGPTWEGLVDAVVSKEVRATMVLEDVWKTFPNNAVETKIIGDYTGSKGAVVLVREGMSEHTCKELLNALLEWVPTWEAVYGGFKPFYYADVHSWFHDLDQLPAGM